MKAYKIMLQIWLHKPKTRMIGRFLKLPYIYNMKVKFNDDGSVVEVESYKALVELMRKTSFTPADDNHEYMLGYASRTVISKNQDIKATDETSFVEDLIKFNHIQILENPQN